MSNGIGSVWAVNFGEEGRPNGVGPVWIANASAFSGGGDFPASAEQACSLVETNSATWNGVSGKLDTTAFSDVSGSFLTAHQDLSDYATTAQVDDLSAAIDYVSANAGTSYTSPKGTILIDGDTLEASNSAYISEFSFSANPVMDTSLDFSGREGYPFGRVIFHPAGSSPITGLYSDSVSCEYDNSLGNYIEIAYYQNLPLQRVLKNQFAMHDFSAYNEGVVELASVDSLTSKQDTLDFSYNDSDEISAINSSAIVGASTEVYPISGSTNVTVWEDNSTLWISAAGESFDVMPISGTGAVNVYEQSNVLWVSGKDFTGDISYVSGVVGDVETLLASL